MRPEQAAASSQTARILRRTDLIARTGTVPIF